MKDNFSAQADLYARYRPGYPDALVQYLCSLPAQRNKVWDAATGNGQLAIKLSPHFQQVYATDISARQLQHAPPADNITYRCEPAEQCSLPADSTDLITVAQAMHWLDAAAFYREVRRVASPDSWLALIGYGLIQAGDELDEIILKFYTQTVGIFWDKERKHIDTAYREIPFPFEEVSAPAFTHPVRWNLDTLLGYLGSWSAVQHYTKHHGHDPVEKLRPELESAWGTTPERHLQFPLFCRIGRIKTSL